MKFNVLGIDIYMYSITMLISFLIGIYLFTKEAKKHNIDEAKITDFMFVLIIVSIIGARIYYVLFKLDYYLQYPLEIIMINNGGLAIYGGVLASLLYIVYFCKKNKLTILRLTDILVISLILGQVIGRWGNFFNQEAYGMITTLEYLKSIFIPQFVIDNMYILGNYRMPTFYFESFLNAIGLIILLLVRHFKGKNLSLGVLTSIYLIYYGIVRTIVEGMRTDSLYFFDIRVSQLLSVVFVFIGIGLFVYRTKYKRENYYE